MNREDTDTCASDRLGQIQVDRRDLDSLGFAPRSILTLPRLPPALQHADCLIAPRTGWSLHTTMTSKRENRLLEFPSLLPLGLSGRVTVARPSILADCLRRHRRKYRYQHFEAEARLNNI
jgi:hypothetical protein